MSIYNCSRVSYKRVMQIVDNNKFILINLNQTVSRFQLEEEKAEKNRWIVFGVIVSLFLILILWFVTINFSINNLISDRRATIEKLENEKNLENSINDYQKLISLNNFIEKKFQKTSKDISKSAKEKIVGILKKK